MALQSSLYFFLLLFFFAHSNSGQLILAQATIPARFDGFVYENRPISTDSIIIEAFFDPICPDSRDAWPPLKQALDFYGQRVYLTVHPFPLPFPILQHSAIHRGYTIINVEISKPTVSKHHLQEGKVRAKLAKILVGYEDVHYENSHATGESIKASMEWMRLSKFCLHPAGDTPSSCRLFDAVVTNCVLVIVSDQIELPYEDKLDYTQFSVFFSVKEALELRQFPKDRSLEMWRQLKSIPNHFEFQYPPKKEDAVNMIWRHVKHKVPAAKLAVHLAVHRSRRLKVPDWCTKGDSRAAFLFRYYTPLSFIGKTFTIE
ncbi:hypothetical protein RHGRI_034735 [Rhododendron griersonianum]|uniref:Exostosin GT47 domain-containing protein n=1 Tax=Rhododendron griersonianum TaxID=479676 RepID=A0AAV6I2C0_9ERIC|nr:hypothetical protein RHGRI_034735 [Rhododendron griersonianum]